MAASTYRFLTRDQNGARKILDRVGALTEIRQAVLGHYKEYKPGPAYKPQEIKKRLRPHGWKPEVRVPPFHQDFDHLPINERYDLWKPFPDGKRTIGIAIEIDPWNIWNDLLKFRRGLQRGQIAAGVLLHDTPYHLHYCFEHLRHVAEPLFGHIPILFTAPSGKGLRPVSRGTSRKFKPFADPASALEDDRSR